MLIQTAKPQFPELTPSCSSQLIQSLGAKRVLEVGTLGGWVSCFISFAPRMADHGRYSALWMEQSIPKDGELITLEFEQKHADVRACLVSHSSGSLNLANTDKCFASVRLGRSRELQERRRP